MKIITIPNLSVFRDQLTYKNWIFLQQNMPIICSQTSNLELGTDDCGILVSLSFFKTSYDNHLSLKNPSLPWQKEVCPTASQCTFFPWDGSKSHSVFI